MILSVSRRTDIPNYYSEWFYNRIKEGFLYVRNPMNAHQISEIKNYSRRCRLHSVLDKESVANDEKVKRGKRL